MRRHLFPEKVRSYPLSKPEYPQNSDQWDEEVFSKAVKFTVVYGRNPRTREKYEFNDLYHAFGAAEFLSLGKDKQKAMVYAVTAEGRHTMLIEKKWKEYLKLWLAAQE